MPDVNQLIDRMEDAEFKKFANWYTATLLFEHLDFSIAQPAVNKLTKAYNGQPIKGDLLDEISKDIERVKISWEHLQKKNPPGIPCPDAELSQLFQLALTAISQPNIHTHRFKYVARLRLFINVRDELVKFMEDRHAI